MSRSILRDMNRYLKDWERIDARHDIDIDDMDRYGPIGRPLVRGVRNLGRATEDVWTAGKRAAEDHPFVAGALTAGAGALGLRKLLKKQYGLHKQLDKKK